MLKDLGGLMKLATSHNAICYVLILVCDEHACRMYACTYIVQSLYGTSFYGQSLLHCFPDHPPPKPKRPSKEVLKRYSYHQHEKQQQQQPVKAINILQSLFGEPWYLMYNVCVRVWVCVSVCMCVSVYAQHGKELVVRVSTCRPLISCP